MALSIAPSEYFRGNDGQWSTFNVYVGTSPQMVELLPATSLSVTLVVLAQGCPDTDPSDLDCIHSRGNLFNPNTSQDVSWSPQNYSDSEPLFALPFDSEQALPGYGGGAEAGFDTVNFGWDGKTAPPPLHDQVVLGYAVPTPWLGMFGLSGRPSHMFNATASENSLLQSLMLNNSIGGLYWAYTAGASYISPQSFASLTLGGYDAARVDISSAITVPFASDTSIDLSLAVTAITISGAPTTTVSGLGSGLTMFIDSVVPEIWLPPAACAAFEIAFGLTWNDTVGMYLVNETHHASLLTQNANVIFELAGQVNTRYYPTFLRALTSATATNISSPLKTHVTLPYSAFDLTATFPVAGINDSTTQQRYFPLKRAANHTQFLLGRTFLQEAYLMVDYNQTDFMVAQALHPGPTQQIVTVYAIHHHKSNVGMIAGIAVGAAVVVALVAGLLYWRWRRRRQVMLPKQTDIDTLRTRNDSVGDTTIVGDVELDSRRSGHGEYFKPLMEPAFPDEDYMKPELDATETATRPAGRGLERHELDAGGFRPVHRHQTSWGSNGSGSVISPMGDDHRVRSMMGHPSPPMHPSGSPSPPLSDRHHSRHFSGDLFEMP